MTTTTTKSEVYAIAKYIRMSPFKVRRVLKQIQGKSYKEALMILEFMPYAACKPVLQVLQSAGSNAQNNNGISKSDLIVHSTSSDAGPVLKRFRPRAQGRGFKIKKPTCHIKVVVTSAQI
jgi:large subunit ribosomal protein L22